MKFAKPLVLPGAGFRTWLILVSVVAILAGFMASVGLDTNPFAAWALTLYLVGLFALLSVYPVGLALWVSVRHFRSRHGRTAAAYALVPVVAVAIATLIGWSAFTMTQWSTTQFRLWRFCLAVEAARETGQIVETRGSWIDPGPPTRAKFELPSMFFIGVYIIYAEASDMGWLNDQARKCQAEGRVVTLGKNFYRIAGEC